MSLSTTDFSGQTLRQTLVHQGREWMWQSHICLVISRTLLSNRAGEIINPVFIQIHHMDMVSISFSVGFLTLEKYIYKNYSRPLEWAALQLHINWNWLYQITSSQTHLTIWNFLVNTVKCILLRHLHILYHSWHTFWMETLLPCLAFFPTTYNVCIQKSELELG